MISKVVRRLVASLRYRSMRLMSRSVSEGYPKKIIEHMEVDFALSRVFNKIDLSVLDIGAHHGEFVDIFGAFNHWHRWKVYCVEPLADNRKVLNRKIGKFKNVKMEILPIGISDVSEVKTFYLGSADTLFTCSENWKEVFPDEFKNSQRMVIDCLTVQDAVTKYRIEEVHFDLVKVDVEGHDLNVIESLCRSQLTATAIIFEVSADVNIAECCIELLRLKGFNEFYVFGRKGIPTTYIGEYVNVQQLRNLFADRRIEVGNIVGFSS